ncbi:MAG: sulfurtransferase [Proteobacteria bacterium]|nr:sulfurtransferase [Pseudomonadota bacterium]
MSLPSIDPLTAKKLIDQGALLVDIREADEYARECVPGALHHPLSRLTPIAPGAKVVIFHCRSGARTSMNAARLGAAAGCQAYLLAGGIDAWKRAGLPVAPGGR